MARSRSILTAAALTAAALLPTVGIAAADPTTDPGTPAPATSPTTPTSATPTSAAPTSGSATPTTTPPAVPQTVMNHAGTYTIGTDIVAGTYASAGPVEGDKCYWKRIGGDDSTLDNALSGKPQVVQIDPTDKAFKTNGCQTWQLTDAAPPTQTPPWLSQLQLRHYLDVINGLAGQSGNGQLPPS